MRKIKRRLPIRGPLPPCIHLAAISWLAISTSGILGILAKGVRPDSRLANMRVI